MNFVDNGAPGAGDDSLSGYSMQRCFLRVMGSKNARAAVRQSNSGAKVPLGLKLGYTAFVAVVVWNYWTAYGPTDLLWFPLIVLTQLVLTTGLALLVSALTVHFRDVRDLLANLLTLWFFATPIIYPITQAPERVRRLLKNDAVFRR